MDAVDAARRYYDCLDDDAYDELRDLLDPAFRHLRPDRTIDGREPFVSFMAEERPRPDTVHAVDAVFGEVRDADADGAGTASEAGVERVAIHGRLFDKDGSELFPFVDIFRFEDGALVELTTFTR